MRKLCEMYGWLCFIDWYDLKKQKVQFFTYFAESDGKKMMTKRKYMKAGKYEDLEVFPIFFKYLLDLTAKSI